MKKSGVVSLPVFGVWFAVPKMSPSAEETNKKKISYTLSNKITCNLPSSTSSNRLDMVNHSLQSKTMMVKYSRQNINYLTILFYLTGVCTEYIPVLYKNHTYTHTQHMGKLSELTYSEPLVV